MPRVSKNYKEHLFERLQTPEEITGYLNAAIEDGDIAVLLLALRDVAEVQGISSVAAEANLNRENIYRMLSDQGNPRLSSFFALLEALGIGLQVKPVRYAARAAAAAGSVAPKLQKNEAELEQCKPAPEQHEGNEYESTFRATDEPLAA